jgi:hypothetical protein
LLSVPPSAARALAHLRAALAANDSVGHVNVSVTAAGLITGCDASFQRLAWVGAPSAAFHATTFAILVPGLRAALRQRAPGAPRSIHDAWIADGAIRLRYWLFAGTTPALTDVSIYLCLTEPPC